MASTASRSPDGDSPTTPSAEGSITRCLEQIRVGDQAAAQGLWSRYFGRLVALASARLRAMPRRVAADGEDVVVDVFDSFFRRAGTGGFPRLDDRDDLWQVLYVITLRKASNLARRELKPIRGSRGVDLLSALEDAGAEAIVGEEPSPELAAEVAEEYRRLLDSLGDETLERVAVWRMDGPTNAEIAAKLALSEKSVERKPRSIRMIWNWDGEVER